MKVFSCEQSVTVVEGLGVLAFVYAIFVSFWTGIAVMAFSAIEMLTIALFCMSSSPGTDLIIPLLQDFSLLALGKGVKIGLFNLKE